MEKNDLRPPRMLALCDAPTKLTGFALVARELLTRWRPHFERIDVWGIGYAGEYHELPFHIYPAHPAGETWYEPKYLVEFIQTVLAGGYTHIWIIQDTFNLIGSGFPGALRKLRVKHGVRSVLYFPVDAPLEKEWCEIVAAVDVAVAYTDYGRREVFKHVPEAAVEVQPHGVDQQVYRPMLLPAGHQRRLGLEDNPKWPPFIVAPDEVLLLNVNKHQRRKDFVRCLEILAGLRARGMKARLLFHFHGPPSGSDGIDLRQVGEQMGIDKSWWSWTGEFLPPALTGMSSEQLNSLYNTADLYLTTTLGEGWGLGITEAIAAGCPVAAPDHTSIKEIFDHLTNYGAGRFIRLPLEQTGTVQIFDNSRVRYRVDVPGAVEKILTWQANPRRRRGLENGAAGWLSWDRIAAAWLPYFALDSAGVDPQVRTSCGISSNNRTPVEPTISTEPEPANP